MPEAFWPRLLNGAAVVVEAATTLAFAAIFVIFLLGILFRYAVGTPLFWSDELAMIVFVWCTLVVDAVVTRERDHVAFDVLWNAVGARGRRIIAILQCLLFAAIFAAALPAVLDYVLFLRMERTAALEWRLDWVFLCFVLYIACAVVRLLVKLARLCGPGWQRWVADDDTASTASLVG
jgi:TRAP-type C4-dicarboxylate transport system permease small subunit